MNTLKIYDVAYLALCNKSFKQMSHLKGHITSIHSSPKEKGSEATSSSHIP